MSRYNSKDRLGCCWHAKKYKRPIAYSTEATSDFLTYVVYLMGGCTVNELYAELTDKTKWLRDPEAIAVVKAYIDKGCGSEEWVAESSLLYIITKERAERVMKNGGIVYDYYGNIKGKRDFKIK